jgi:8-oxo-dGTP pyrophosphatase MutT (NUDIX family)
MNGRIIPSLARKLDDKEPILNSIRVASVAVIVTAGDVPKTLLIRRAERGGDPWSGQIAFPGGKREDGDMSSRETAIRETKEEIGVDLSLHARYLGYFRSFRTHNGIMDVVPCVFLLEHDVGLMPNPEVSSYRWIPLSVFADPGAKTFYEPPTIGTGTKMPALAIGDYTVWGLTYTILSSLLMEDGE